ncbi:MAG: 4-(cytidine 5'-diphospho)-2-C-methyl-D-erythritol kinase [Elusimicrobiota bacterium]
MIPKPRRPRPSTARLSAHAKVNLFLEVTGRHADGYHTLSTLFQEISLADEVRARRAPPGSPPVSLDCGASGLPDGPENLAFRAAALFQARRPKSEPVAVALRKRIPLGAGLGGGSSDAAAVLRACGLLRYGRPAPWKSFLPEARALGADVPFFLAGGLAQAGGIGDRLTPLPDAAPFWMVLVYPRVSVSTKEVYARLRPSLTSRRSIHKIKEAVISGRPVRKWAHLLYNRLEEVVLPWVAPVARAKKALIRAGCLSSLMSGSGSAVFGLVESKSAGLRVAWEIRREPWDIRLVESQPRNYRR